jgi:hypothetical protein
MRMNPSRRKQNKKRNKRIGYKIIDIQSKPMNDKDINPSRKDDGSYIRDLLNRYPFNEDLVLLLKTNHRQRNKKKKKIK